MNALRTFSYGGGVQSTAALVLAAQRVIDFPVFLMANVGDDSEDPLTIEYVENHAKPYAARHGIELHVIDRIKRDGTVETVYGRITKPGAKSHVIPVRLSNGAPGGRSCTADFKIRVVGKWLKAHGATEQNKAVVGIGISLDEIERINARKAEPHEKTVYPLISVGEETGLKLNRDNCGRIILDAGLPLPPKSSCWFCPFHRPSTWAEMRRDRPELFEKACQLEDHLNRRQRGAGKDPVYLTRFNRPLGDAIAAAQDTLPGLDHVDLDDAECDNGVCFV